ncbi:MAG: hypothetical protein CM1200mP1_06090 [Candidatus Neomarinimicrobiota bacterium]|nr:MAG: hypothetical protein CM1200mP1_06090 [Candidatus Neomarinimicrobiota bacterium]
MCRSGVRSAQACEFLQPLGFDVYNLTGGLICGHRSLIHLFQILMFKTSYTSK